MRAGDSVCQNRCRMQGRCVVGDCSNTEYEGFFFLVLVSIYCVYKAIHLHLFDIYFIKRIEYSSSFDTSIPIKLDQKREKYQRSGLICAKRKSGSRRGFFRSRVRRYYKNLQLFMACIFFFIFSGKLDIFMILHYDANLG